MDCYDYYRYAECCYAQCRYAEYHGTIQNTIGLDILAPIEQFQFEPQISINLDTWSCIHNFVMYAQAQLVSVYTWHAIPAKCNVTLQSYFPMCKLKRK